MPPSTATRGSTDRHAGASAASAASAVIAAVAAIAAGWGLSDAQRWYLETDLHRALQSAADREGLALVQQTLSGQDMGAVELTGLIDPLVKTMTLEADAERARLVRPGEAHLRGIAQIMAADGIVVLNRRGMAVAEWQARQAESAIGSDFSRRSCVPQALKGRSSIYTGFNGPDPQQSQQSQQSQHSQQSQQSQRSIVLCAPIFAGRESTGAIIGAISMHKPAAVLDPFFASRQQGDALLISPRHIVFAASRPGWEMAIEGPAIPLRAAEVMKARQSKGISFGHVSGEALGRVLPFNAVDDAVATVDGRRMAVATTRIDWNDPDGAWRLVLLEDLSGAMSARQQLAVAASTAMLLLGGYALMRQIAAHRRKRELSAAAFAARAEEVRAMFRMAPIGVCLIVNDRIEFLNPLLSAQLGTDLFQRWPHRYADEASRDLVDGVLRERRRVLAAEVNLLDAQGEARAFVLSSMPLDYEGDKPAVLLWLVDITRHQEAAREARRAMQAAHDAALAKSSFLAGMSHEIRSPMNVIVGMSDLALQTGLDARQRNYLEKVNGAALSLLDLIDDILDFSSIESGRIDLERVPFQLDQVLERLVDLIGLRAEDKGVELLIHRPADVPDALIGDPMRLGQVLINLGANAVKFTDSGEVIVAVERDPHDPHDPHDQHGPHGPREDESVALRFSVTDSGIGMTAETISRLFHSFNQADTSTTRQYGGSGLGLAVSRQLVEMMGGSIQVSSRPGERSTFAFTVRLGLRPGARAAAAPVPAALPDLSRLRVLVADDNRAAREILGALCAGFGMRVDTAVNGANAAQCVLEADAEKRAYDLVLMDWQMPVLDGLEATRLIASGRLASPPAILLVTAFGRDAALAAALAEADPRHRPRLLSKPVTASTLLSAIGEATGQAPLPALASPHPGGTTRAAMARLTGTRLLVVEDDPVSRELSAELLRAAGLDVTTVPDGQTALDLLARSEPGVDAVLMDCQMPGMDGYETTRRLRRDPRWRGLPVIALTASATQEARERILAAGMSACLIKPLSVDRLFETLSRFALGARVAAPVSTDAALDALLARLSERLRTSDASAVDLARALSQALERQPPPPARLQLLRRVAAAASGFRFDEALALLSWDAGAPAGAPPA